MCLHSAVKKSRKKVTAFRKLIILQGLLTSYGLFTCKHEIFGRRWSSSVRNRMSLRGPPVRHTILSTGQLSIPQIILLRLQSLGKLLSYLSPAIDFPMPNDSNCTALTRKGVQPEFELMSKYARRETYHARVLNAGRLCFSGLRLPFASIL